MSRKEELQLLKASIRDMEARPYRTNRGIRDIHHGRGIFVFKAVVDSEAYTGSGEC